MNLHLGGGALAGNGKSCSWIHDSGLNTSYYNSSTSFRIIARENIVTKAVTILLLNINERLKLMSRKYENPKEAKCGWI